MKKLKIFWKKKGDDITYDDQQSLIDYIETNDFSIIDNFNEILNKIQKYNDKKKELEELQKKINTTNDESNILTLLKYFNSGGILNQEQIEIITFYYDQKEKEEKKGKDISNLLKKYFFTQKLKKEDLNNTISMHFRLGDYKKLQDFHPIAPAKYYENALSYFEKEINYKIIYFCEEEDLEEVLKTIEHLKIVKTGYTFIRGNNTLADWEQMLYMSLCSHNIIANSSFSWWGAYFNTNLERRVLYPETWFGPTANNNTKDLCPPDWVKINYNY